VELPLTQAQFSRCGKGPRTVLNLDTIVRVQGRLPSRQVHLASVDARYSETDFGLPIADIRLVQKISKSSCRKGGDFGAKGTKAWVDDGCRGLFEIDFGAGAGRAKGLMTVDSLDGYTSHDYGIAWRHCQLGRWVQTDGEKCEDVCRAQGMTPGQDPFGARCVSGEARPSSAAGLIGFPKGCWGGCAPQGDIQTATDGRNCYRAGQKHDSDKTDRTVGCYCK
jgi:hypothetical protein